MVSSTKSSQWLAFFTIQSIPNGCLIDLDCVGVILPAHTKDVAVINAFDNSIHPIIFISHHIILSCLRLSLFGYNIVKKATTLAR